MLTYSVAVLVEATTPRFLPPPRILESISQCLLISVSTSLCRSQSIKHSMSRRGHWLEAVSHSVTAWSAWSGVRIGRMTMVQGGCDRQLGLDIVTRWMQFRWRARSGRQCVATDREDGSEETQRRAGGQRIGNDKGASHVNQSYHMSAHPTPHMIRHPLLTLQCRSQP